MEEETKIRLRRVVVDPAQGPEAVHHFVWARAGSEFLFEVGYVDLLEVHHKKKAVKQGEETEPVDFVVTHRFSMSAETVQRLSETVAKMVAALSMHEGEEGGPDA